MSSQDAKDLLMGQKVTSYKFKGDDWTNWAIQTKVLAAIQDCEEHFEESQVLPTKVDALIDKARAVADRNRDHDMFRANVKVFAILVQSYEDTPLYIVNEHEKNPYNAWAALKDKYYYDPVRDFARITKKWNECILDTTARDPQAHFLELNLINKQLAEIGANYEKDPNKMAVHITEHLHKGYASVLTMLTTLVDDMGWSDVQTLDRMKRAIQNHWEKNFMDEKDVSKDRNQAFSINHGKFKGKCNKCGKTGHKAVNCWSGTGKGPKGGRGGNHDAGGDSNQNKASGLGTVLEMRKNWSSEKGLSWKGPK